jgi:hypothetical protein
MAVQVDTDAALVEEVRERRQSQSQSADA